ncbi:cupin domain-containing protein [Idiomarina baltica]|uniref:Predicted transcription negative regulator n=1 Tax=Idiomarina baltica OS145 TaxID=314276 RepID=A0ABP2CTZ1_9GAMM|nr:cupin domain-containing protein [Idiomarina baltica]EAQ33265.1 Predicted transcription negative regulator [Idiomarina baltica OS145]
MLNLDFQQRVVINTSEQDWIDSPSAGVKRKLLEREEAERGRATSIVEYKPGASFNTHSHPLGEEILVLSGVFSDEYGDYPAGTYLRNPPGSSHAPFSKEGCVLLVKLHQFQQDDTATVRVNTQQTDWLAGQGRLKVMPLHSHGTEHVALVKWPQNERFKPHRHLGGEEIFVLSGEFCDEHGRYPKGTWLRNPHMSVHHPFVDEETVIWVKTGHLG